jgi:hypothetical protein
MKVTVKKNLIIFHRLSDWDPILDQLSKEYGAKIMISYVCKRELGFTVRRHKGLEPHDKESWAIMKSEGWDHRYYYQDQIHLDFYNDAQQSFFVLKYLDVDLFT